MAEQQPDDESHPPSKIQLDYRNDRQEKNAEIYEGLGGGIFAAITVFVVVFLWILSGAPYQTPKPPFQWLFPTVITVGAVVIWVRILSARPSRTFVIASLIGLGIALLIEGLCFGIL